MEVGHRVLPPLSDNLGVCILKPTVNYEKYIHRITSLGFTTSAEFKP
jgi:hypothetical protein